MRHAEGPPLTPREIEVLRHIASGRTYKQTARILNIKPSTIRTHVNNICRRRLNVSSTTQAALVAVAHGWLRRDELVPDYSGREYTTHPSNRARPWVPSPAQRLYLDAFDVLLKNRSPEAARTVDFYFRVMCRERAVTDRRVARGRDIDSMLLTVAVAARRPIPLAA